MVWDAERKVSSTNRAKCPPKDCGHRVLVREPTVNLIQGFTSRPGPGPGSGPPPGLGPWLGTLVSLLPLSFFTRSLKGISWVLPGNFRINLNAIISKKDTRKQTHAAARYTDTARRTATRIVHQRVQKRYESGLEERQKVNSHVVT